MCVCVHMCMYDYIYILYIYMLGFVGDYKCRCLSREAFRVKVKGLGFRLPGIAHVDVCRASVFTSQDPTPSILTRHSTPYTLHLTGFGNASA